MCRRLSPDIRCSAEQTQRRIARLGCAMPEGCLASRHAPGPACASSSGEWSRAKGMAWLPPNALPPTAPSSSLSAPRRPLSRSLTSPSSRLILWGTVGLYVLALAGAPAGEAPPRPLLPPLPRLPPRPPPRPLPPLPPPRSDVLLPLPPPRRPPPPRDPPPLPLMPAMLPLQCWAAIY